MPKALQIQNIDLLLILLILLYIFGLPQSCQQRQSSATHPSLLAKSQSLNGQNRAVDHRDSKERSPKHQLPHLTPHLQLSVYLTKKKKNQSIFFVFVFICFKKKKSKKKKKTFDHNGQLRPRSDHFNVFPTQAWINEWCEFLCNPGRLYYIYFLTGKKTTVNRKFFHFPVLLLWMMATQGKKKTNALEWPKNKKPFLCCVQIQPLVIALLLHALAPVQVLLLLQVLPLRLQV